MNTYDSAIKPALHTASGKGLSPLLCARLGAMEARGLASAARSRPIFTLGADRIDQRLGGGLLRAALHELHAADREDGAATAAFALLLAERVRKEAKEKAKPLLWISESGNARRQGRLYPPGLIALGLDPNAVTLVDAPDTLAVLRAAAEAARSSAIGAVIASLSGKRPKGLDLTATRRLSLAAARSGTVLFLLRFGGAATASAAYSRWDVAAAPSLPLAANAPGHPAFAATLTRHRRGLPEFTAQLEWNSERQCFAERRRRTAPLSGLHPALSAVRKDFGREDLARAGRESA